MIMKLCHCDNYYDNIYTVTTELMFIDQTPLMCTVASSQAHESRIQDSISPRVQKLLEEKSKQVKDGTSGICRLLLGISLDLRGQPDSRGGDREGLSNTWSERRKTEDI